MDEPQAAETPKLTGMALDNAVLRARIETLTRSGIIEVALQNPNVMSYMEHWETRAEKAELRVQGLETAIARALGALTYPVASEIDPRGYSLHSPNDDRWEFVVDTLTAAGREKLG